MSKKKSYQQFDYWKKFQPFFAKKNQLTKDKLPKEEYISLKGMQVHLDRYLSKSEKATPFKVMVVHGGGANGRLMSPIALELQRNGYEVLSPDLPGFGLTSYKHIVSYQDWIDTLCYIIETEYEKDKIPFVLFGMSLGGMLTYQVACLSNHVKGLIVTTLADTTQFEIQQLLAKNDLLAKQGAAIAKRFSLILDPLKVPIQQLTSMNKMANNADFVQLLRRDKVGSGSWVYLKWIRTLQSTKAKIAPENFDRCPLLFLHPEKDTLLSFDASKSFYDRLNCKKEMYYLTNCGHIPLEEPGITEFENYFLTFLNQLK